ncbi:unnamed protein product, partial [Mycolicibacterium canariasense]
MQPVAATAIPTAAIHAGMLMDNR